MLTDVGVLVDIFWSVLSLYLKYLQEWNGKPIVMTDLDMVIETDASLLGWGARCTDIQTSGLWSDEERMMHINCLELLAGALAVNTLAKSSKDDNTTAVSPPRPYITSVLSPPPCGPNWDEPHITRTLVCHGDE